MKPVIAIPQMGNDLFRIYMKSKYVQSLHRAGAEVRWLELEDADAAAAGAIACDGLLLPGGADVDPRLYGQEPSERCGKPNQLRDRGERRLLEVFLPAKKPVFCICRGVQLLNVFCSGTLWQDIKGMQKCAHSHFLSKNKGIHSVTLSPGTRLAELFAGQERVLVNSLHHQAVDRVGSGLTVSAVSEDGFVEALELSGHPFCIGVQWHPEHMSRGNAQQQALFYAFAAACGKG